MQSHFPTFMAANKHTQTQVYLGLYTHDPRPNIQLWFTGMLATVTHLPLIINLTVQHQWVTFCLVYVDWQQKHELVTL